MLRGASKTGMARDAWRGTLVARIWNSALHLHTPLAFVTSTGALRILWRSHARVPLHRRHHPALPEDFGTRTMIACNPDSGHWEFSRIKSTMAVIGMNWRMRPSATLLDLAVVICFGLAIAAVYGFRMTPRLSVQSTGCSAAMISRGHSGFSSGVPAGYCLVFDAGTNGSPIISPLSSATSLRARPIKPVPRPTRDTIRAGANVSVSHRQTVLG
jgi:hypothetical protein